MISKILPFLFIPLLVGCFGNNRSSLFQQQESLNSQRNDNFSGNLTVEKPLPQPMTLVFTQGANASAKDLSFLLVPTIPPPANKASTQEISSGNSVVAQTGQIKDSEKIFNPWTYLLYALGLFVFLICVFIIYLYLKFLKNKFSLIGGGIALDSVTRFISTQKAKTTDEVQMKTLTEFELEVLSKIKRLNDK